MYFFFFLRRKWSDYWVFFYFVFYLPRKCEQCGAQRVFLVTGLVVRHQYMAQKKLFCSKCFSPSLWELSGLAGHLQHVPCKHVWCQFFSWHKMRLFYYVPVFIYSNVGCFLWIFLRGDLAMLLQQESGGVVCYGAAAALGLSLLTSDSSPWRPSEWGMLLYHPRVL